MASVKLEGVRKSYGGLAVVDDIDLAIGHGELVCLLGPSGCGKTTTLRLVAGFIHPDAGTITVGARALSGPGRAAPPEQRNMSMIFQSYALWPHMTVRENVAYGLRLRRLPAAEIERRLAMILGVTRLQALGERYPGELSGGQQQRVALARALVVEPETLLLDEPLSNLDTNLREEMRYEIRRLHDEFRYTTLYVTHDQLEAMTTADRIVVMNGGRIEQAGAPEDVFLRPQSEFVARFIGGTNIIAGENAGGAVRAGPLTIVHGAGEPGTGSSTRLSIRPHDIALATGGPGDARANQFAGTVLRHTFLGTTRDYLVEIAGGHTLRVSTGPGTVAAPGQAVTLHLPERHCRALPR